MFQDLYKSSQYSEIVRPGGPGFGGRDPTFPIPPNIPEDDPRVRDPNAVNADDVVKEDVANSKSLMIIMIVAPVCIGAALIIIGCILLVWYMRLVQYSKRALILYILSN